MKTSGYGRTLSEISARAASAIVGRGHIRSEAARKMLLRRLAAEPGSPDSLIAPPIYEASRIWQAAEPRMEDLSGDLLRADLVDALALAGDQAIPLDRHPYWHQLEAWKQAKAGKSYMVTSGTGSGKTECFMVPMLNDLLNAAETGARYGVRGLILYPLNALIESQRERLAAWSAPFDGRISYALYNGDTPETPSPRARPAPAEIRDRRTLRRTPANLLVTNVTMLEYMLTRAQDRDILEQSQGQLRWIVLDEAHTYVGAQAAEMALLLRRVRQAFGVKPEAVRLVATSATIGEGVETVEALRRFVAALGGVSETQVEIIMGREEPITLPPVGADSSIDSHALMEHSPADLWAELAAHPRVRKTRSEIRNGGARLSELSEILAPDLTRPNADASAQVILDAMAQARPAPGALPLAPWRLNAFQRSQAGLWACVDPDCPCRAPELSDDDSDWPFGQIHLAQIDRCPSPCGAPVFEIGACNECGTPWLMAHEIPGAERRLIQDAHDTEEDDFRLDVEPDDESPASLSGELRLLGPDCDGRPSVQIRHSDAVIRDVATEEPGHTELLLTNTEDRNCCAQAHYERNRVSVQRFGAPFLLGNAIPQLLEAIPRPEDIEGQAPFGGRRLLSFTDSRQGTARFAAKLQQEAERNLIRAGIWHAVQARGAGDPAEAAQLRTQIGTLAGMLGMESVVADLKEKLAKAEGGLAFVSWSEMVDLLANNPELRNFAGDVWLGRKASHDHGGMELAKDPVKLARFLLLREVFRRPKLQNNVETMGLARLAWPELERRIGSAPVPAPLAEAGHDATIWQALGLATVDFGFRGRLAVWLERTPVDLAHWISPRQASTQVAEPGLEFDATAASRKTHRWYSALSNARLVELVYRLIGGSKDSATDRERCQSVLDQLWTLFRQSGILRKADAGCWQLDFEKSALIGLETAWQCPVTHRLLPYSVGGLTPNDPRTTDPMAAVSFPRLPVSSPTGLTQNERDEVQTWLQNNPNVAALGAAGHWTNWHNNAATFAPFLRAQEHSAQIDRASLKGYEDAFRAGRINVLTCSTTMEMGVDIPNVGTVVNTNVPPAPSNYRQRVGRAGRRGEPWALSFTFCKDKPLDWQIFRQPEALLRAEIPAPAVRLDSPVMVARHVNALLLSMFLRREGGVKVTTQIGSFFGTVEFKATDDPQSIWTEGALADQFLDELDKGWATSREIREAIALIVRGTVLEGKPGLAATTATAFDELRRRWRAEYEQLVEGWRAAPEKDPTRAFYANRARRMRREFLMTELARRGFTPAYGYPVDVVSFDHVGGGVGSGPSRQLDIAIRDYAPGSEVVIDGLVHKCDGILPAWSNRADPDSIDDLRTYWNCKSCAAFGLSRGPVETCPECGDPVRQVELLRPSGFLGKSQPHAGYEQISFVPPDRPRVSSGSAQWTTLPDPSVGRVRASRQGEVVFTASGGAGHGYAICLACGRSEQESGPANETPLSKSMQLHFPLQPVRDNPRHDGRCPANDDTSRKVRRNVVLGNAITTDVFEWQIREVQTTVEGRAKAMAIAAALREALAKSLGIEAEDMGVACAPGLLEDGNRAMSVFLFDKASGGAGFSPLALDRLPDLVKQAADILNCPANCASGCPECVLRGDTQHDQSIMDRHGAYEALSSIRERLILPGTLQVFGPESRALQQPLPSWLGQRLRGGQVSELTIYLHGEPQFWDLRDLAVSLPRRDEAHVARVVLPRNLLVQMEAAEKVDLVRFLAECGAKLHAVEKLPTKSGHTILCHCQYDGQAHAVAALTENAALPDAGWGAPEEAPVILGPDPAMDVGKPLSAEKLAVFKEGNSVHADVGRRLDGKVGQFGHAFWKTIREMRPQIFRDVPLKSVVYSDRYLRGPLPVKLLQEVLRNMPDRIDTTKIQILSSRLDRGGRWQNHDIEDNWTEDRLRLQVMKAVLGGAEMRILDKRDCPHPRRFVLEWADGRTAKIHLDQGLGAWTCASKGTQRFDVEDAPESQARRLTALNFEIRNRQGSGIDSPIWVSW
ncbi:DEAD/DEAH box helicase [Tropicimonas sp. TH_r6]|uniref:DEAD/DEAH box helicase n=1 Tax=Tropicimonas sp. TH_r6 TaxID=3082085 RepID=UPI00295326F2|nr:DEAD/DEAH box helicase [Tropicimonas sp. TH_r6]MDV7145641.1 DEAD/DEAH box helicase [Tropicimonas sp. TH_r6]